MQPLLLACGDIDRGKRGGPHLAEDDDDEEEDGVDEEHDQGEEGEGLDRLRLAAELVEDGVYEVAGGEDGGGLVDCERGGGDPEHPEDAC